MSPLVPEISVINYVPNQAVSIAGNYKYNINISKIFSGNIQYFTLTYTTTSSLILPGWISFDNYTPTILKISNSYATKIIVVDNFAYIASGDGLRIVDVSNPLTPTIKGTYLREQLGSNAEDLAILGNFAYIAAADAGVQIIYIGSGGPSFQGTYYDPTKQNAYCIAVSGHFAYVQCSYSFQILDISNPSLPTLRSSYYTGGISRNECGVTIFKNFAYIVTVGSVLTILDIHDPENPRLIVQYQNDQLKSATSVTLSGNFAYIVDGWGWGGSDGGIQILDISTPDTPKSIAYISSQQIVNGQQMGTPNHMFLMGDLAYVAGYKGLQILDLATPSSPQFIGNYRPPNLFSSDGVYDLQIVNHIAYLITDGPSGTLLNIINLIAPRQLKIIPTITMLRQQNSLTITAYGSIGNKITTNFPFTIIDPSQLVPTPTNSATPTLTNKVVPKAIRSSTPTPTTTKSNTLTNSRSSHAKNLSFTIIPQQGISILLSSNELFPNSNGILKLSSILQDGATLPSWLSITFTPKLLSSYRSVNTNSVAIIGTMAYVADDTGLKIIDLSNLYEPKVIGNYLTANVASSITVVGSIAYLATSLSGLQIINIGNPTKPIFIADYTTVDANNVIVINNTVLVTGTTGLHIFNKNTGQQLGNYLTTNPIKNINVQGNTAFIATGSGGLEIVNISDLTNPTLLGRYTETQFVNGVTIINTMALITDLILGLQIIDINNLNKPIMLGQYRTLDAAQYVTVSGSMAFIVDNNGLQIIDISSVIKPTLLGSYKSSELLTKKAYHTQDFSNKHLRASLTESINQTSNLLSYITTVDSNVIAVGNLGLHIIDCTKWTISGMPPNNTDISNYDLLLTGTDPFGENFTRVLQIHMKKSTEVSPSTSPTASLTQSPSPTSLSPDLPIVSPLDSLTGAQPADSNKKLYIGLGVGGGVVGVAATAALVLYCYKKRQKNISRILPTQKPEISEEDPGLTSNCNPEPATTIAPDPNRFFSTLRQGAAQAYTLTTEPSQPRSIPFSLSSPSILDGRELYPHYEEAGSNRTCYSPSSRPFLANS